MPETNCDICLTDETLTFVNIANTTMTSKKIKIEAIGHDRIYACLDKDPSATFINNVYSTCLSPVVVPDICENATPIVGLYIPDISYSTEWKLVDANTEEVLLQEAITASYQDEAIRNIVDTINNSNIGLLASYIYDDGSPFSIKNISDSNITLRFELINESENFSDISQYYNDWNDIEENPSFTQVTNTLVEFCLTTDPDRCISSPPYTFNTENTIVKVPHNTSLLMYVLDKEYGDIYSIHSYADNKIVNEEIAFHVSDLSVPEGLIVEVDTSVPSDIESCSSYSIEGTFYVDQHVSTWYDSARIGLFYVEINGQKTYLENSSRSFEHNGSSTELKTVLAPYYLSIETFLKTHGIDAEYDPDSWGSYNTGAILVKLTQEQGTYISIGTDSSTDYDLLLEGYFYSECIQYKTFEELENGPATITLKPINYGSEYRSSFTLLANHVPDNPDEINILTLLGVTEDIDMQTCFRSGDEG